LVFGEGAPQGAAHIATAAGGLRGMPMWTTLPHLRRLAASASLHVDRTVTFHHRCMVTLNLDLTINLHHCCMVTLNLDRTINFHRRCMMTLNPPRKKCGFCEHMRLSIGDPAEPCHILRAPPGMADHGIRSGKCSACICFARLVSRVISSKPAAAHRKQRQCEPRRLFEHDEAESVGEACGLCKGCASLDW